MHMLFIRERLDYSSQLPRCVNQLGRYVPHSITTKHRWLTTLRDADQQLATVGRKLDAHIIPVKAGRFFVHYNHSSAHPSSSIALSM